jgi:hypothetical protein
MQKYGATMSLTYEKNLSNPVSLLFRAALDVCPIPGFGKVSNRTRSGDLRLVPCMDYRYRDRPVSRLEDLTK